MSKSASDIKTAVERTAKALTRMPATGRVTRTAVARLVDGLTCELREGDWKLTADEPEALGGNNAGPVPGALARMSLASCLAIGYGTWLARSEVPYNDVQVEVEVNLDLSGLLGVDDSLPPAPDEMRVRVHVDSPAPRAEVERVLELADRHSPQLHLFTRPITLNRELNLTGPPSAAALA
jgi:uncharacterized OsmC-like protein